MPAVVPRARVPCSGSGSPVILRSASAISSLFGKSLYSIAMVSSFRPTSGGSRCPSEVSIEHRLAQRPVVILLGDDEVGHAGRDVVEPPHGSVRLFLGGVDPHPLDLAARTRDAHDLGLGVPLLHQAQHLLALDLRGEAQIVEGLGHDDPPWFCRASIALPLTALVCRPRFSCVTPADFWIACASMAMI